MMIIGSAPMRSASKGDKCFDLIINGKLLPMLENWKRDHFINDDLLELLESIFQYEHTRISIQEIKKSPWLS